MMSLLLDHIWQSSACAGAAALLVLPLSRNGAAIRFWVWFAASVKFLLPFAALTALGSYALPPIVPSVAVPVARFAEPLARPGQTIIHFTTGLAASPTQQSQPLTVQFTAPAESGTAPRAPSAPAAQHPPAPWFDWESALLAVWAAGFVMLAGRWLIRWLRVRALMHGAMEAPMNLPMTVPVAVKVSASLLEPGLVGIFAPVILLPEGIAQRLSPVELKAVLAHELCHWRRHDNLAAAIHMLVEALFWFVPLVWWIGAHLNAERERACDEAVLAEGNEPQIYADGILKVCRAYLQSPLACVSGISGSGLTKRITAIMENRRVLRLNAPRKLALGASAAAAIGVPLAMGLLAAPVVLAKAAPIPLSAGPFQRNIAQGLATPQTAAAPPVAGIANAEEPLSRVCNYAEYAVTTGYFPQFLRRRLKIIG